MLRRTSARLVGVSGFAAYAPPCRVDLQKWCDWTSNDWSKISKVVGTSFRIPTRIENTYTMAASAVLRLIVNYDVDPTRIGFLGLGTESSTDNSAGGVIVKGMVDSALRELGLPRISRHCEVPEYKHACLGGIYALKNAVRYAHLDAGDDKVAIVVASDIAEYALGSSGEQTQGAGSVAMLVERNAKLFDVELMRAGSSSEYRGPDFRKPIRRHFMKEYGSGAHLNRGKVPDFPVFSGPYSTMAYLDQVTSAVEDMLHKLQVRPSDYYNSVSALFFHRPYHMMPVQAMSFLYVRALARASSAEHRKLFDDLCTKAKVTPGDVEQELDVKTDYFHRLQTEKEAQDAFPNTNKVAKVLRGDSAFTNLLDKKMHLGSSTISQFGNLYTGSLPCWMAAGFEEACKKNIEIAGHPMVMVGYGSGDASESIPISPVNSWKEAASKINVTDALSHNIDITREQYEGLHNGTVMEDLGANKRSQEFVVDRIGQCNDKAFQDIGIEYYKYVPKQSVA